MSIDGGGEDNNHCCNFHHKEKTCNFLESSFADDDGDDDGDGGDTKDEDGDIPHSLPPPVATFSRRSTADAPGIWLASPGRADHGAAFYPVLSWSVRAPATASALAPSTPHTSRDASESKRRDSSCGSSADSFAATRRTRSGIRASDRR